MKEKEMMIDYRGGINPDGTTKFVRKHIDNFEFCIREGVAYFISEGKRFKVPIQEISQVYVN